MQTPLPFPYCHVHVPTIMRAAMLLASFTDYRQRTIEIHDSANSDTSPLLRPLGADDAADEAVWWCLDHRHLAVSVLTTCGFRPGWSMGGGWGPDGDEAALAEALRCQRIVAFHRWQSADGDIPFFAGSATGSAYAAAAASYAKTHEVDMGTPVAAQAKPPTLHVGESGVPVPSHHGSDDPQHGWDDELSDECPNPHHRSETLETASPEVLGWLQKYIKDPDVRFRAGGEDGWKRTLGCDGGGGFLATTTRVILLTPPMKLYRYAGGAGTALGSWWFAEPLAGDPRSFGALPPGNTGETLVCGKLLHPVEALTGLGAPRCSNKPGGPVQYCLPWGGPPDKDNPLKNNFVRLIPGSA